MNPETIVLWSIAAIFVTTAVGFFGLTVWGLFSLFNE